MNKQTIFITGATGVLGKRVCLLLARQGHRIVALSRSHENLEFFKKNKIEARPGDLFDRDSMLALTRGCDVIIHMATYMPRVDIPRTKDWLINDKIRTIGTSNLVEAALQNNISLFIQPSITFLYGQQNGNAVTETTRLPEPPLSMAKSAIKMETLIRENLDGNVPYIILRFGMFYSEDSFHTINLIQNIKDRKVPMIGDGRYYWNFVHVDDAARAVLFSLENAGKLANGTFNISDYNPVLYKDLINELISHFKSKRAYRIPNWVSRLLLGKDIHGFLTNSYRIIRSERLKEFFPVHTSMIDWVRQHYP